MARLHVSFEHVDACIKAARLNTASAWEEVLALPLSAWSLGQAGCTLPELMGLIENGMRGEPVPENMPGYLVRKVLRIADPGFPTFVDTVREHAQQLAEAAADLAAAYLPQPLPERPVVRFAGYALADAYADGNPVINLGDFYFSVLRKTRGDEATRTSNTIDLLRRVIAHELHHVGLGPLLNFPEMHDSDWLLKLIISEGAATLLWLPLTEDDAYYFTNWSRHIGRLEEYLSELAQITAEPNALIPDAIFTKWVMNMGAAYYVGATMCQAIERAFGRDRLVSELAHPDSFYGTYRAATPGSKGD